MRTQENPVPVCTIVQSSYADILNLVYLHSALTMFVQNVLFCVDPLLGLYIHPNISWLGAESEAFSLQVISPTWLSSETHNCSTVQNGPNHNRVHKRNRIHYLVTRSTNVLAHASSTCFTSSFWMSILILLLFHRTAWNMKHTQSAARLITCERYPCERDNDTKHKLLVRRAHARRYRVSGNSLTTNWFTNEPPVLFRTGVPKIAQIHKEAAWAGSLLWQCCLDVA